METTNQAAKVSQQSPIVITKTYDAAPARVWRAWTDVASFKQWWGPKAFTCPDAKLDVRVGGKFLAAMRDAKGKVIWSGGTYQEVDPGRHFAMTDSFTDAQGHAVSPESYGMPKDMPRELTIAVSVEDLGNGKTRMTLRHTGFPPGKNREDCIKGWEWSLEKLEQSLRAS